MKLKKYLLMLPLLLMTVVMLSSCGDDDDKKDEPAAAAASLVGTWVCSDDGLTETITLNADGTGTYSLVDGSYSNVEAITWSANGTILTLTSNGESMSYSYQLLNANTLSWGGDIYTRL